MPPPTWMPPGKPPAATTAHRCRRYSTCEVSSWALSLKLMCRSSGSGPGTSPVRS